MPNYIGARSALSCWLDGLTRMVDFSGVSNPYAAYDSPAEADAAALADDWAAVGADLASAMDVFKESWLQAR